MGVNNKVIKPVYDLLQIVILLPTTQKVLSRNFFIYSKQKKKFRKHEEAYLNVHTLPIYASGSNYQ